MLLYEVSPLYDLRALLKLHSINIQCTTAVSAASIEIQGDGDEVPR